MNDKNLKATRRNDRADLGRSSAAPLHDLAKTIRGVVLMAAGLYTGGLTQAIFSK